MSNGSSNTTRADVDFAIQMWPGGGDVRENGIWRNAETPFVTGDVFKIAVESGVVKYYKNGSLFYTSGVTAIYPLLADTWLLDNNSTINNVVISGAQ